MTFLTAVILGGAAFALMRNWLGVAIASTALILITGAYEWRAGSSLSATLTMAALACFTFQASFLAVAYLTTKYLPPPTVTAYIDKADAPVIDYAAPLNRNDRRMSLVGAPSGKERRTRDADC